MEWKLSEKNLMCHTLLGCESKSFSSDDTLIYTRLYVHTKRHILWRSLHVSLRKDFFSIGQIALFLWVFIGYLDSVGLRFRLPTYFEIERLHHRHPRIEPISPLGWEKQAALLTHWECCWYFYFAWWSVFTNSHKQKVKSS